MNTVATMRQAVLCAVALAVLHVAAAPSYTQAIDCNNPPPPDQSKNFLQNFLTACYAIDLHIATPNGNQMTDLDQAYAGLFYRVNPKYELILIGEFPRGRYLSITASDSHHATSATIHDSDITPIAPQHVNPFTPGVVHREDQLYAVTMQFGGSQPDTVEPGCDFGGLQLHANILDASKLHEGISWNGSPGLPPWLPPHEDVGPNTGGLVTVRQYLAEQDGGAIQLVTPKIIIRDLTTGCAAPALKVYAPSPEEMTSDSVITFNRDVAYSWVSPVQVAAHQAHRSLQQPKCYSFTPSTGLWFGPQEYVELPNPDAGYVIGVLVPQHVSTLVASKAFMRIRFRLPSLPSIPCSGCSLTGSEQVRYFSLSFYNRQKRTLASLGDFELTRDPDGYVTVIVGFGSSPPSHVIPENYYTYFDLAAISGYEDVTQLGLRTIIPSPDFRCSAKEVPVYSSADNSVGGFMGEYLPVVDLVLGEDIPAVAEPLQRPDSCGVTPPEAPGPCSF